jgi:hypothetical protein
MKEIKKLYRAYSVVNYLNDSPFVIWYNSDNKMSAENYKDLIKDYTKMSTGKKRVAECFVNEFFSCNQIIFLNQFLKEELGTGLMIEEFSLPVELQSKDEENNEIMLGCISEAENAPETHTINLNILETYDLSFMVNGIYLQSGSSNEILDKIVAYKSSSDEMINADQLHEEIMEQLCSEALAAGNVKLLGETSLQDYLDSLAAGRVRFVAVSSLAGLDINNMKKVTIH